MQSLWYILRHLFGPEDVEIATTLINYSNVLLSIGDSASALSNYSAGRDIFTSLGPSHASYVAAVTVSMGNVFSSRQQHEIALKCYLQALEGLTETSSIAATSVTYDYARIY